ncbi:MAG: IS4 family transposase [Calditrichaeota bacterium]|nr:MAG: IS4 family transposase [Calditrichota bacterium]
MEMEFPTEIINQLELEKDTNSRDRVFSTTNTLLTMVLTATQVDKSMKNSVTLYHTIHQQRKEQMLQTLREKVKREKERDVKGGKKAGRPKHYQIQLSESLKKDISLNTAAYSKARDRVPLSITHELFKATRLQNAENAYTSWHGHRVFLGDGTYLQMQDTEDIRKQYDIKNKGESTQGYPQGLLEVLIERGTGQVYTYRLANRHTSELPLLYDMIDEIPQGSVLLLDDLYNCFEIFSKCKRRGIEIVVPAKREKQFELIEHITDGDDIILKRTPKNRSKWLEKNEDPGTIMLRRIECKSPDGSDYLLYTTILERTIKKDEFQLLYLTRWDVEISIREVKTIMNINILRSKTPDMVLKELTVALSAYNLIRKVIYASIKDLPFSPIEDIIFKFYTHNQELHVDKKGRVYSRWSTGRKRAEPTD